MQMIQTMQLQIETGKKRVDVPYHFKNFDSSGLSCWIEKIDNMFCRSECFPDQAQRYHYYVSVAFLALIIGFWPLTVFILLCKNSNYIILLIEKAATRPPTFSTAWGVILSAVILLVYMTLTGFTLGFAVLHTEMACYKKGYFDKKLGPGILIAVASNIIMYITIIATSKLPTNIPVPKCLTFFLRITTFYCLSEKAAQRIIILLGVWSVIGVSLGYLCLHLSFAILAVLTDPYRNGFIISSITILVGGLASLLAAFVSLDQIFIADYRVAIHWRAGLKRCLSWLFLMTLALCGATFLAAIHCLVLMDIRLPVRYSINFSWIFSVILTMLVPRLAMYVKKVICKLFTI